MSTTNDIPAQTVTNSLQCLAFDEKMSRNIGLTRAITGIATLCISLIALGVILYLRAVKQYPHRLFFYLTLTTLIQAPTFTLEVLSVSYNKSESAQPLCNISGVYTMYTSWLQNLIILWITLYLVRVVVLRLVVYNKKFEIFLIILFLILPIPVALIPLIHDQYGMVEAWCWIKDFNSTDCERHDALGIAYQYTLWFVPVALEVAVIAVVTVVMAVVLCARGFIAKKYVLFQYEYRRLIRDSVPLLSFPVFYCSISCFELILYGNSLVSEPKYTLWMLNAILTPCKGILMILGYLIPMIWIRLKDYRQQRARLILRKENWRSDNESSFLDTVSIRFQSSGGEDHYGSISIFSNEKRRSE